jgi:hypothetical protein
MVHRVKVLSAVSAAASSASAPRRVDPLSADAAGALGWIHGEHLPHFGRVVGQVEPAPEPDLEDPPFELPRGLFALGNQRLHAAGKLDAPRHHDVVVEAHRSPLFRIVVKVGASVERGR